MKIRGWHNHTLLKSIQIVTLISMPICIILLIYFNLWYQLLIAGISIILISKIGHSAGQHRYFCHSSFKTGTKREWILGFLATICTTYSAPYYAAVHRYHHSVSDSENDPHTPKKQGMLKSFFGFLDKSNVDKIPSRIIKDLIKNKPAMFFHNWYWPTLLFYCLILVIINPVLFVSAYIIPVGYTQFVNGTQTFFGHKWGYKNYNTGDDSCNNIWWNIITLGEGLHNNHHERPWEYNFAWDHRPGEKDFTGWLIKTILILD